MSFGPHLHVHKQYDLAVVTNTSSNTVYIADEIPHHQKMQLRCRSLIFGQNVSFTTTAFASSPLEIRLYNALSTENVWNNYDEENYVLLGYITYMNGATINASGEQICGHFVPAPPVTGQVIHRLWKLTIWNPKTRAESDASSINYIEANIELRTAPDYFYEE